jgi:sugar phosphate isomerase/epimerase
MMNTSLRLSAAAATLGLTHGAASGAASRPGFKIGACDWTLGKRGEPDSLAIAKKLGLDGVQVDLGSPDDDLPVRNPDHQKRFLDAVKEQGLEIASVAIGALNDVPYKSDPRAEQWVLDSLGVCKAFGVQVVLLAFFGNGDLRNDPAGVDAVVERLKKAAPMAQGAGVVLGIESWLSAEEHLAIIERVGSPAVKVYYDVGNSNKEGHDIYKEIRQLGTRHICEFHAKDYDNLYGKGSINFPEVRRAMDDIGYRGWMQIEGTQFPLGLEASIRQDVEYLRGIFPREV